MSEPLARLMAGIASGVGVMLAAIIAIVGYRLVNRWENRAARKQWRMKLYNRTLTECVGPLLSHNIAAREAHQTFKRLHPEPLTDAGKQAWRIWMQDVLMEHNLEMERIIRHKGYMLLTASGNVKQQDIKNQIKQLLRHVNFYKKTLASWQQGDYSVLWYDDNNKQYLDFPEDFDRTLETIHYDTVTHCRRLIDDLDNMKINRMQPTPSDKPLSGVPSIQDADSNNPKAS